MTLDTTPTVRRRAGVARRLLRLDAWTATAWYVLITLAMTWPLAAGLTRRLPLDLGDPLLNCWILQWDLDHLLRILRGDWQALTGFWNANIFYPEPLALAYSEHLFAQAVQALPLYALTHNIVFCYDVLFLSTFVLSGLGAFLLARELTGSARAGFVAGLFYAFTPYRLCQLGHLQVLSSQWMPFALYAATRWAGALRSRGTGSEPSGGAEPGRETTGARRKAHPWWLALAVVAQNLSCGYFLLYFPPFLVAYVVWLVASRRVWRDARTWRQLTAAALVVAALTLPFLMPYLQLRQRGVAPRPLSEVREYSADPTTYLRATNGLWLWPGGFADPLSTEAVLFPGFTPVALSVLALACLFVALRRRVQHREPLRGWRLGLAFAATLVGLWALALVRFELFAGGKIWRVRNVSFFLADIRNVFTIAAAAGALVLLLSARARAGARLALGSGRAFFAAAFFAAVWLSFGPQVTTRGLGLTGPTLYAWLYAHVPGFDGLRVPARFGMLAMLFLAIVGGYGAAVLGRWRAALPWVAAAFFLIESTSAPINVTALEWKRQDGRPGTVSVADLDRLYAYIAKMPAFAPTGFGAASPKGTVVVEFPFANLHGETRAVFLSTLHRHPILNGYSGGFPASYEARKDVLQNPVAAGEPAWQALLDSGATCIVVHEWAFDNGNGPTFSRWLEAHGATLVAVMGSDRIYAVAR